MVRLQNHHMKHLARRKRLPQHRRARLRLFPAARRPGRRGVALISPAGRDDPTQRLVASVLENVCGLPNVWGLFWRAGNEHGEILVVATPPVTKMVLYLLDSIAREIPGVPAGTWKFHCAGAFPPEGSFRCAYRRFV